MLVLSAYYVTHKKSPLNNYQIIKLKQIICLEISLLREDGRRTATCRAATMLDLYSLSSSDFRAVLDEFPAMQSLLADVAVERLQRLDKYSDEARTNNVKRYALIRLFDIISFKDFEFIGP